MKKLIYIIPFIALAILASCNNSAPTKEAIKANQTDVDTALTSGDTARTAGVYQCPMDCENGKTYSKPGQCPVCGMDLEKIK